MEAAVAATADVAGSVVQVSIFDWLTTFFQGMQFQELWVFVLVGFIGIYAHYVKKLISKELDSSFYSYLVGDHPASTLTALSTFFGAALTYVFSGTIDSASWPTVISLAFTTGFAVDSALNKSTIPEFTPSK